MQLCAIAYYWAGLSYQIIPIAAGFVMGVLAATTAAVAFLIITCIPKTEPALVVSLWFHLAAVVTSIVPLVVRLSLPRLARHHCLQECKSFAHVHSQHSLTCISFLRFVKEFTRIAFDVVGLIAFSNF